MPGAACAGVSVVGVLGVVTRLRHRFDQAVVPGAILGNAYVPSAARGLARQNVPLTVLQLDDHAAQAGFTGIEHVVPVRVVVHLAGDGRAPARRSRSRCR